MKTHIGGCTIVMEGGDERLVGTLAQTYTKLACILAEGLPEWDEHTTECLGNLRESLEHAAMALGASVEVTDDKTLEDV